MLRVAVQHPGLVELCKALATFRPVQKQQTVGHATVGHAQLKWSTLHGNGKAQTMLGAKDTCRASSIPGQTDWALDAQKPMDECLCHFG